MLPKIRISSVRAKITILFALFSFFLCALTSLVTYYYVSNALIEESISNITKIAAEQTHHTAQIIKNEQLFAKMLGTKAVVRKYLLDPDKNNGNEVLVAFSEYATENSKYLAIYLLDTHGNTLVSTDPRFVGKNFKFRDYFKSAMRGEASIDNAVGSVSDEFGYYYSYPVKDPRGSVIGVMVVKTDKAEIDDSILTSELTKTTTVMLVDHFGIILAANRPDRFLKSVGTLSPERSQLIAESNKLLGRTIASLQYDEVQNVIDNYTGSVTIDYLDPHDNEKEVISVIKFEGLPFFMVSEIGMESLEDLALSIVMKIIALFLIGILLVSFLAYRAMLIFISPLSALQTLSEAIRGGDFSQRIVVTTNDEFGELAETMNTMASSLSDTFQALESKVRERTQQLEKLIEEKSKHFEQEVSQKTEEFKRSLEEKDKSLEVKVAVRTDDLKQMMKETEQMNKYMIGRELKMTELKKEIAELKEQLEEALRNRK